MAKNTRKPNVAQDTPAPAPRGPREIKASEIIAKFTEARDYAQSQYEKSRQRIVDDLMQGSRTDYAAGQIAQLAKEQGKAWELTTIVKFLEKTVEDGPAFPQRLADIAARGECEIRDFARSALNWVSNTSTNPVSTVLERSFEAGKLHAYGAEGHSYLSFQLARWLSADEFTLIDDVTPKRVAPAAKAFAEYAGV